MFFYKEVHNSAPKGSPDMILKALNEQKHANKPRKNNVKNTDSSKYKKECAEYGPNKSKKQQCSRHGSKKYKRRRTHKRAVVPVVVAVAAVAVVVVAALVR